MTRTLVTALAVAVVAAVALAAPAQAAEAGGPGDHNGSYTGPEGRMGYQVHVPPQQTAGRPLPVVVAIHGCGMSGSGLDLNSMKAMTAFNDLADREGFLVLYPDQSQLRDPINCWRAKDPSQQIRGRGEPELIAGATEEVLSTYHADRSRVHVVGASSGAGMAVIMAVTYPDVYATASSLAGGEYGFDRYEADTSITPQETAQLALAQMGPRARVVPLLVGQGTADTAVPPFMAERLIAQFAALDTLIGTPVDGEPDQVDEVTPPGLRSYTHSVYTPTAGGPSVIEEYLVDGMEHNWPGPGKGVLVDDTGPDFARLYWDFAKDRSL
jgi:poly(hydroxyalkanoate) depolymerase family esterase